MKKIICSAYLLIFLFILFLISIESIEAIDITSCTNITSPENYTLINNLTSLPGQNCILITSSDVALDCGGNEIFFSGNGRYVNAAIRVQPIPPAILYRVSITNCRLIGNSIINEFAIYTDHTNDIFISNNSLDIEATIATGIYLRSSARHIITNNSIRMNGSVTGGMGAIGFYQTEDSLVAGNNIYIERTGGTNSLIGVIASSSVSNISVQNNNITLNTTNPSGTWDYALTLTETGGTFSLLPKVFSSGNRFEGYGGFRGIFTEYIIVPGFLWPNAVVSENDYIKIYPHNLSYPGIYSSWAYPINSYINFKNVTLATEEGSINIINDSRAISGGYPLVPDQSHINISHNLAYLNSTAFPDMNRRAIVTLLNTNVTNPVVEVDYERRNNFTICQSCRIISSSNGNVTFSVTGWSTTYFTAYRVSQLRCPLCGDVNGDGRVTSVDAMIDARIANRLIIPTPSQAVCGDVNRDGAINVLDALLIARKSAGFPVTLRCA